MPAPAHPTREDLEREIEAAQSRHRRFARDVAPTETFSWLLNTWEEERDRCRRDLETCPPKELAALQVTISVLGRVLARSSLEAFQADIDAAENALAKYDDEFPLFKAKEAAKAVEPAPSAVDPLEAFDDGNDGGEGICSAESEDAEEKADAPNWVTGDDAAKLRALNKGRPSELQRAVDAVASGWVASVTDQTSWSASGDKTDSAKATAYCPGSAGGVIGRVSAPNRETLAARVAEADAKLKAGDKALSNGSAPASKKKGAAKRERAKAAGVEDKRTASAGR